MTDARKIMDYCEAIIALAEKVNTPETQAVKTLAIQISNVAFKAEGGE